MNKSQKNERLNIWVKERKIYEIRTKRCWERIKSTDVEDDLELEEKGTHYLLRPEERRKGWVGYRSWESSCFDNEFFIKQQVQSSAEGWWTAARSGGLRKGRRFGIDTKTTERESTARIKCQVALRVQLRWVVLTLSEFQIEIMWDFFPQEFR